MAIAAAFAAASTFAVAASGETDTRGASVRVEQLAPAIEQSTLQGRAAERSADRAPAAAAAQGEQVVYGTVAPVVSLAVGSNGRVVADRSNVPAAVTRVADAGSDTVTAQPR